MNGFKSLIISIVTFFMILLCVDIFLKINMPNRFLPAKKMKIARSQGQGCIVFAGNSRMASAFKKDILEKNLGSCVADISIGSLDVMGITITLREYLKTQNPKFVVLGFSGDMLIADEKIVNPHDHIGNRIVLFSWGQFSDSAILYPHLTEENFDDYLTYIYFLNSSLAHYISTFWIKVQHLQDRLTGKEEKASNEFGTIDDMVKLGSDFSKNTIATLNRYETENKSWADHPWFLVLKNLLKEHNIPLILVEIPMPTYFRKSVQTMSSYHSYQDWLKQEGLNYLDSKSFSNIPDNYFKDPLHFNDEGGKEFSLQLAKLLKK